eukprot:TRINITY_DN19751_c0_g1_i1.p1 TRINITY_DN19751_c0_g1~~TRINITY_DN19751_c0_g1_i1.p1  ORF type:complete len:267 (+),score=27.12 TRINITY_DN19751_c0_g1_i1:76-876(+)
MPFHDESKITLLLCLMMCVSLSLAGELRNLKDLGPTLNFVNGTTVRVTRPGEGQVELPKFSCEGFNCMHRRVKSAVCTHDPAALDASLNIMWSCEEDIDELQPKTGHPSSLFIFSPTKLICDSNVSAVRGLPWVPLDTFDVIYPGFASEDEVMPDQIFVDPDTCVLIYKIENLGAPDEHFSLFLVVSFAMFFAIIAICPANCCPRGSDMPTIDPAVLPASLQRAQTKATHPPLKRRNVNGPRAVGNTVSHSNINLQQDTFPIDSAW